MAFNKMATHIGTIVIVFVAYALPIPVLAGETTLHWRDLGNLGGPDISSNKASITWDPSNDRFAVITEGSAGNEIQYWTFNGSSWELQWEGIPDLGIYQITHHFGGASYVYFDAQDNLIKFWGVITMQSTWLVSVAVFEYSSQRGFVLNESSLCGAPYWSISGAYNWHSKVAVLIGTVQQNWTPVTVEFDGNGVQEFPNPADIYLSYGRAAFDPISRRVVYFGYSDEFTARQTYEYWDHQWVLMGSSEGPEGNNPLAGMYYVPEFDGIVAIPYDFISDTMWLYKGHRWGALSSSDRPHLTNPIMGYNPQRHEIVLFGGIDDQGVSSRDIWVLGCTGHCRSVRRP